MDPTVPGNSLFTDLYELTMAASFHRNAMTGSATFDLFVRRLPPRRGYLVACGLDTALAHLEHLSFGEAELAYLRSLGLFDDAFLELLRGLRFTGDVAAVPEGEIVFADEPILRLTAPIIEAQLVETALLNHIGFQTLVATKAARLATACGDRAFVDFSARRDHGADAALRVARASYIGGASGTSLVEAGRQYGISLSGTMAHSYVMRFDDESDALATFAEDFPGTSTLLIDTYDTENGARAVVALADRLRRSGALPAAVRLDSGDLDVLARSVRHILDDGGLRDVRIFASGDLDEDRIARLVSRGAPIDAYGVGTQLGTGGDVAHLDAVYKLVEANGPRMKRSPGKVTQPGRKQIHRLITAGVYDHDVLALDGEAAPSERSRPLLAPVMVAGRRVGSPAPLDALRRRRADAVGALPPRLAALDPQGPPYEVRVSAGLAALAAQFDARPPR